MKWYHLTGKTDYISDGGSLIVVYHISEKNVVLIDSGERENPQMLLELKSRGLRVRAVLCTHLHLDHTANNPALIERDGTEIFAGQCDVELVRSVNQYQKEYGIADFEDARKARNKLYPYNIVAIPSDADYWILDGVQFGILQTPGHSKGHIAVITPDGVCCVGDALVSERLLSYLKMPYMSDVNEAVVSMEKIRATDYPVYVVAHKQIVHKADLDSLVDGNIEKEFQLYNLLRKQIDDVAEIETLTTKFLNAAEIVSSGQMRMDVLRQTAKARIIGLVQAGEFRLERDLVIRCWPTGKLQSMDTQLRQ